MRAYSLFEVKSLDDSRRILRGIATTPTPDRDGDIVEPLGVKVAATIPMFLFHDSTKPVGTVKFGRPAKSGIPFEAEIPNVVEDGRLKDRVDEAWQMVKYRLITAVSIGMRVSMADTEPIKGGNLRIKQCEVLELSLVPIPANAEATITSVKHLADLSDEQQLNAARATSGHKGGAVRLIVKNRPGASGSRTAALSRGAVQLISKATS